MPAVVETDLGTYCGCTIGASAMNGSRASVRNCEIPGRSNLRWGVYVFISYLILAIIVPTAWTLWPIWRRARLSRQVTCPADSASVAIALDPWYAVSMHAMGNCEVRVKQCARWPAQRDCRQECLTQIGPVV